MSYLKSWFIGVFPLEKNGNYVGFYHAESHRDNESGYENNKGVAYKSIGVTYSDDYGKNVPLLRIDVFKN